jgi:hypothetical protein
MAEEPALLGWDCERAISGAIGRKSADINPSSLKRVGLRRTQQLRLATALSTAAKPVA